MRPYFSSGPCIKYSGWDLSALNKSYIHRSHRSAFGKSQIHHVIEYQKEILNLPEGYRLAIVPGSATGAMEMGLWCFLGSRGVDLHIMDVFSDIWAMDVQQQLKIQDVQVNSVEFGSLPLLQHNPKRDLVITWSATSTGVGYPNANWIHNDREGLVIVDATAAAFCVEIPFEKLDVVAFSWQKGLGGEAAHGVIVLSPRALKQLEIYKPAWPIPRVLNLWAGDTVNMSVFEGATINTPSMLAIADAESALDWVKKMGGMPFLYKRSFENTLFFYEWVKNTPGVTPMASWEHQVKGGPVCFYIDKFASFDEYRSFAKTLEDKNLAYDIVNHARSKPSLRVWCGPTVELDDLKQLTQTFETFLR